MKTRCPASLPPAVLLLLSVLACDATTTGAPDAATGVRVEIRPRAAEVLPGATVAFEAVVTGTASTAVVWSVVEAGGGSVDGAGRYVAPSAPGTYHVVATSVADPSRSDAATVVATATPSGAPCANAALRTTGVVHYFCDCSGTGADPACVPGNDANAGTSPSAPRRTLASAAARFNAMNAGDTVALCRGGAWNGPVGVLANPRCRATSDATTCDFRDYVPPWGSAATARPRVNSGTSNAFTIWDGGVYEGYRFWNLDTRQNHRVYDGAKSYYLTSNRLSHVDICNAYSHGGGIGLQSSSTVSHLTVRHSTFEMHAQDAMYVESPYLVLDSNVFVNNGDQATDPSRQGWLHTVYLACNDPATPCPGVRIVNNLFLTERDGTNGYGSCRGMMLILRGYLPGLVVENNLVVGDAPYGCGGISLSGSYAYTEIHDARIRRNRIFWGPRGTNAMAIQLDACQDCVASDNLVDHAGPGGYGILSPEVCGGTTGPTTRNTHQNNTFLMRGGGTGLDVSRCTDNGGFVVENNAAWTSGGTCFRVTRPTTRNVNNHCGTGAPPETMFVNPTGSDATGDYRPAGSGPLAGAANPASYSPTALGTPAWDPADAGIPRTAPIDVGAFQR